MNYLVIVGTSLGVIVAYEMAGAVIRSHMKNQKITIEVPRGTGIQDRLRITRAVVKFAKSYDNATPEKRDEVLSWLEKQDGVKIVSIKGSETKNV